MEQVAVVGDCSVKLAALHIAIRDYPGSVVAALARLPQGDWKARYSEVRDAYNVGSVWGPDHAARLIWLNKHCFNGLYRENRSGAFNVPVGDYKDPQVPTSDAIYRASTLLQGAKILAAPFEDLLGAAGFGDRVYCDPPYAPADEMETSFSNYEAGGFGDAEQHRLVSMARAAAARGARVVISNHDTAYTRALYVGFEIESFPVRRSIGRKGSTRVPVRELLATIEGSP